MNLLKLDKWNIQIGGNSPLLCMMGLNVLEDEGLALEVATELKKITTELQLPYVFKASFDKANRSSVTSYRGPGIEKGLKILKKNQRKLKPSYCYRYS